MLVSYKILALRLALLIEESGKKRLTISERRLKTLASAEHKKPVEENKGKKEPQEEVKAGNASEENNSTQATNHFKSEKDEKFQKEVLSIRYLSNLRDELELLGYFIGSLAGGGYGLLVISSLEGSFSLATELAESDNFFKLNERELQRRLDDRLKQKTQRRKKDTTVTREEINALVWMGLADLAKKKLPIVYGDLAGELGLKNAHYNTFNRPLEQITAFCKDKGLPLLSHLVVRQDTALPASVKFKNRDSNVKQHNVELEKYKEDVKKIVAVDWNKHQVSFEAFVKTKSEK